MLFFIRGALALSVLLALGSCCGGGGNNHTPADRGNWDTLVCDQDNWQ